jgi:hypothetical protein
MPNQLKNEIRTFIINWNKRHPIDYWWRKKYNIAFGSEKHRQADFIQMYFDYEEEKMINNALNPKKENDDSIEQSLNKELSQKDIDYDFENIDISSYNSINKEE